MKPYNEACVATDAYMTLTNTLNDNWWHYKLLYHTPRLLLIVEAREKSSHDAS